METSIKATLVQKNSEMEKLEKSKKSHLRMISSSAVKYRMKHGKTEETSRFFGDTDARSIRMYETHFPGFCYLRNGQCRRKITNHESTSNPDPIQCSQKLKAILFTDNELDIYKTMCLHLLGTHVQNKNHIQRKDGRLCSYVKAQVVGNTPYTLQPISQRAGTHANDSPSKYDKILPRYVLDVKVLQHGISTPSVKTVDFDSGSDEETKKKRKLQVPIYVNNEVRMIINSVMEALEAVDSPKLKALIELASSPEELRNMLGNEDLQEFIIELAGHPLIMKPTSYDLVMAHLMFDKIPEKGTLETVAQVLEVYDESELRGCLYQIRRDILHRYIELVNSNIIPGKKLGVQEKSQSIDTNSKISNSSVNSSIRYLKNPNSVPVSIKEDPTDDDKGFKKGENDVNFFSDVASVSSGKKNEKNVNRKRKGSSKEESRSVSINLEKIDDREIIHDHDESSALEGKDSNTPSHSSRSDTLEQSKYDLHSLSNSQRILLGLKIASLKCKPINMHQFEGKKKVDLASIINPIIRPHVTDIDYKQHSPENLLHNFSLPDRKVRKSSSRVSGMLTNDLENLTRTLLANLRLEISETENKKRVNQFVAKI